MAKKTDVHRPKHCSVRESPGTVDDFVRYFRDLYQIDENEPMPVTEPRRGIATVADNLVTVSEVMASELLRSLYRHFCSPTPYMYHFKSDVEKRLAFGKETWVQTERVLNESAGHASESPFIAALLEYCMAVDQLTRRVLKYKPVPKRGLFERFKSPVLPEDPPTSDYLLTWPLETLNHKQQDRLNDALRAKPKAYWDAHAPRQRPVALVYRFWEIHPSELVHWALHHCNAEGLQAPNNGLHHFVEADRWVPDYYGVEKPLSKQELERNVKWEQGRREAGSTPSNP